MLQTGNATTMESIGMQGCRQLLGLGGGGANKVKSNLAQGGGLGFKIQEVYIREQIRVIFK